MEAFFDWLAIDFQFYYGTCLAGWIADVCRFASEVSSVNIIEISVVVKEFMK